MSEKKELNVARISQWGISALIADFTSSTQLCNLGWWLFICSGIDISAKGHMVQPKPSTLLRGHWKLLKSKLRDPSKLWASNLAVTLSTTCWGTLPGPPKRLKITAPPGRMILMLSGLSFNLLLSVSWVSYVWMNLLEAVQHSWRRCSKTLQLKCQQYTLKALQAQLWSVVTWPRLSKPIWPSCSINAL